jgi:Cu-Zn family superoxide dismutase
MPHAPVSRAVANVAPASGTLVSGRLALAPAGDGVHISGDLGGLAPNSVHGFHIHDTGDCSAADAASAGGHYNPTAEVHGRANTAHHHAGDIDNVVADGNGVAHVDAHVAGVTLGGDPQRDILGRALVVHAAPDDYRTQPSGASGTRIACGVIAPLP